MRAGQLPGLAEWFGTFDGKTVVGWYEGHASSSDSSHLTHFHGGFWNQYANDPATLAAVYGAITGSGNPGGDDMRLARDPGTGTQWIGDGVFRRQLTAVQATGWAAVGIPNDGNSGDITTYGVDIATLGGGSGPVTPEQLAELTAAAHDGAKEGAVEAAPAIVGAVDPVVRDAIADGLEGGAEKVREGA